MEKRFCWNCGAQLGPNSSICEKCGTIISREKPTPTTVQYNPQQQQPRQMPNTTQNSRYQQPMTGHMPNTTQYSQYQQPAEVPISPPPAQKKNGKAILPVLIAAVALLCVCFVFLLPFLTQRDEEPERENRSARSTRGEESLQQDPNEGSSAFPSQAETVSASTAPILEVETQPKEEPTTEPTQQPFAPEPVFLTELPYIAKYGKLWTMSETQPEGFVHTDVTSDAAYMDTATPGHVTGPVYDYLGNRYSCGLFVDGTELASYYVSYDIGGIYSTFSGKISMYPDLAGSYFAQNFAKSIEIYGDGMLLYTSPPMTQGEPVIFFSLDISGIQTLTIMYPETKGQSRLATVYDGKLE